MSEIPSLIPSSIYLRGKVSERKGGGGGAGQGCRQGVRNNYLIIFVLHIFDAFASYQTFIGQIKPALGKANSCMTPSDVVI